MDDGFEPPLQNSLLEKRILSITAIALPVFHIVLKSVMRNKIRFVTGIHHINLTHPMFSYMTNCVNVLNAFSPNLCRVLWKM